MTLPQKFKFGDLVRIADDLGQEMSHFQASCDAIVIASYADRYGGRNHNSYVLYLRGRGEIAWYYENQLTLIERDCGSRLEEWKLEEEEERATKSNLDWIFTHGDEILDHPNGASVESLASCLGLTAEDLWGRHGEGMNYVANAWRIIHLAEPYLKRGDKNGWLKFAENMIVVRRA